MIRYDYVNKITNEILKKDHIKNNSTSVISYCWTQCFLNRHPKLYKIKQKSLELEKKLVYDSNMIQNWFEHFQVLRKEYNIFNEDI